MASKTTQSPDESVPDAAPASPCAAGAVTVDLTAVIVAMRDATPHVVAIHPGPGDIDALPWGPLRPEHQTLQSGLRTWVERQTGLRLGYVEQLYTFGDRKRAPDGAVLRGGERAISVAYLALVQNPRPHRGPGLETVWRGWYDHLPWEDWRAGDPAARAAIVERLRDWAGRASTAAEQRQRLERARLTFGLDEAPWDEERTLERYELLYSARLVSEAWHDRGQAPPEDVARLRGRPMAADHRRILATAIGRLRGKIKYRPVLFELMPPSFTLLQLQRTAEALSGVRLHKQNFRRLIAQQSLVEETGEVETATGGRPAKLMRFRHEVTMERPAPGVRVTATRRASLV